MLRATLFATALALAAGDVFAADIPGGRSTRATVRVESNDDNRGRWEKGGDSDWYKVALKKGQAYYFSVSGGEEYWAIDVAARKPNGVLIGSDSISTAYYGGAGVEIIAPADGTYYLEAKGEPQQPQTTTTSSGYGYGVFPDCAAGRNTTCQLRIGISQQRQLVTGWDFDSFKLPLAAGRSYSVEITSDKDNAVLEILGPDGTVVATAGGGDRDVPARVDRYVPRATGTYYARVSSDDDEARHQYTIVATQP